MFHVISLLNNFVDACRGLLYRRPLRKKKRLASQQQFGNRGRASWSCSLLGGHVLGLQQLSLKYNLGNGRRLSA